MAYLAVFEWHPFNSSVADVPAKRTDDDAATAIFNAGRSVLTVTTEGHALPIGVVPPGGSFQIVATPKLTLTPTEGNAVGFWMRYGP